VQAYVRYFYAEKVKPEVVWRWKIRQLNANNSEYTGIEEEDADAEVPKDDDAIMKEIPFHFKMAVGRSMYDAETDAVKAIMEEWRNADDAPVEQEVNRDIRMEKLRGMDKYIIEWLTFALSKAQFSRNVSSLDNSVNRFLKRLEKTTGFHGVVIVGGPVPSIGGEVTCWS
jgi:hypothetical protein